MFDTLIQEEKLNRCHGCAIQHPSQRQHSCLMMDSEDAWFYYHDEVREKIDLNTVLKTSESVCSVLGFELAKSWEAYVTELPKMPWTSLYLTSLELEGFGEIVAIAFCIPFIAVQMVLKRMISVEWKFANTIMLTRLRTITRLKCNVLRTLSEKKKNLWTLIL